VTSLRLRALCIVSVLAVFLLVHVVVRVTLWDPLLSHLLQSLARVIARSVLLLLDVVIVWSAHVNPLLIDDTVVRPFFIFESSRI